VRFVPPPPRYYYHKEDTLYPKQAGTPSFKSNPHFVGAQT